MAKKGILPTSYKNSFKQYCQLPVHQPPVLPQHQTIPPYSKSLSYIEPESSGDDQIDNESFRAIEDRREKEQLEISLVARSEEIQKE